GAEHLCRQVAERLAARFDIEVVTSCATDYATWAEVYRPGPDRVGGIAVRRFAVEPRDPEALEALSRHVVDQPHRARDEEDWLRALGPWSPAFAASVRERLPALDAVVCFTYLSAFTVDAARTAGRKCLLVPTAHDEPPIHLALYRPVFQGAGALGFCSAPE